MNASLTEYNSQETLLDAPTGVTPLTIPQCDLRKSVTGAARNGTVVSQLQ
jgi:hypothetical protein